MPFFMPTCSPWTSLAVRPLPAALPWLALRDVLKRLAIQERPQRLPNGYCVHDSHDSCLFYVSFSRRCLGWEVSRQEGSVYMDDASERAIEEDMLDQFNYFDDEDEELIDRREPAPLDSL